jgi:EAL domain-containing protein (putative c-di-GMP-specific phosphodiesterase class I)
MGFEALVRWNHPNRGLITPGDFIDVAETTGLMIPMTVGLLRAACEQSAKWKKSGIAPESLIISVNLSASHLAQKGIVDQLRSIIFEANVDPEYLKLEITESAVMQNAESMTRVLKKIRDLGVKLSIDDFGTGYSSLSYLHRFPIDTLKIDRSFVGTMEDGSENGEIVRTVIALAKALNLSVIAEGIESIHQFHQLRILGCEYGQGYLFSRPLPAAEAEKLLQDPARWQNILPANDFGVIARNLEYTHLRIQ